MSGNPGGRLLAVMLLLASLATRAGAEEPPLIPVTVNLERPGFVTLVVEEMSGVRVRNLVSETPFPRGKHTIWWDGTKDPSPAAVALLRERGAQGAGLVPPPAWTGPGRYRIRGLWREAITPTYEFSVYGSGFPPWPTPDGLGGWLADNSPPRAVLFVPGDEDAKRPARLYLGSARNENGSGLAWVTTEGVKQGGVRWIGGNWTGAALLARDTGEHPLDDHDFHAATVALRGERPELRIVGMKLDGADELLCSRPLDTPPGGYDRPPLEAWEPGAMVVRDGLAIVSFPRRDQLQFYDLRRKTPVGDVAVPRPCGMAFDKEGRLFLATLDQLVRYSSARSAAGLPRPMPIIRGGLDTPRQLAIDPDGRIHIGLHGRSHQVGVFSAAGRPLREIGRAGAPGAGDYVPGRMNHPEGLAFDDAGNLWVAEADWLPKRVSVWDKDGKLVRAFHGPPKPGGGGAFDPRDRTRILYADDVHGTMAFKVHWGSGRAELDDIPYRPDPDNPWHRSGTNGVAAPETVFYRDGRRYATNAYNSATFGGAPVALLFIERDGTFRPAAGIGMANGWSALAGHAFASRWPRSDRPGRPLAFFFWSDVNGDGQIDPVETVILSGTLGGVTVMSDLSFCVTNLDGRAVRFEPVSFTPEGVPLYDRSKADILLDGIPLPKALDSNQILSGRDHWVALATASDSAAGQFVRGAYAGGGSAWSYPYTGPGGVHGIAANESRRGVLGPTARMLGPPIPAPTGSNVRELWALNGRDGAVYLFTMDGLMVATLFPGVDAGKPLDMSAPVRGMAMADITLGTDNFWPTLVRTDDGSAYLVGGARSNVVRLQGLDTLRRLPDQTLDVSAADLAKARTWLASR